MMNTRRRVLGLLAAIAGASRVSLLPAPATAANKQCYGTKGFGAWKGIATDKQAGARLGQIVFSGACDLRAEMQVAPSYDAKLVIFGNSDTLPLPKDFLVNPKNRLIARDETGKTIVDAPLCGVCTEIRDDKVSIVLPLAVAPLLRERASVEMAVQLLSKEECRFTLDCDNLRKALAWASQRQGEFARAAEDKKCTPPPEGCFITTACCGVLGLSENCFELMALRRYRDRVLALTPQGREAIALYYRLAPDLLVRMQRSGGRDRLLQLYARYILPSALAASFRLNGLTFRLYAGMMERLAGEFAANAEGCDVDVTVKQKPRLRPNQAPLAN